jgi:hypothetical protein
MLANKSCLARFLWKNCDFLYGLLSLANLVPCVWKNKSGLDKVFARLDIVPGGVGDRGGSPGICSLVMEVVVVMVVVLVD